MFASQTARILVVTDHPDGPPGLLDAIRDRARLGPAQFRVLVTNPAKAEAHLRHPERHEKAAKAEQVLRTALPALTDAAGSPVLASVSVRHDPYLAVEELLACEPIDEVIIDLHESGFTRSLHLDLPHRLVQFGLPVTSVQAGTTKPR